MVKISQVFPNGGLTSSESQSSEIGGNEPCSYCKDLPILMISMVGIVITVSILTALYFYSLQLFNSSNNDEQDSNSTITDYNETDTMLRGAISNHMQEE